MRILPIQQQYQQHPHLAICNVPLDYLLSPRLSSHYIPRPGLPIQDLTEAGAAGRIRFPSHVHNNLGTLQTSKQREQGGALLALDQRGGYLNKNFEKTLLSTFFLTTLDLLLGSRSIHFIVIHTGNLSKV